MQSWGESFQKNIIFTSSIEKFFLLISEVGLVEEDKNSIPSLNVKIFSENLQQPSKSHRNFFLTRMRYNICDDRLVCGR